MSGPISLVGIGSLKEREETAPYVIVIVFFSDLPLAEDQAAKELATFRRRDEDSFSFKTVGEVHCPSNQPFTACVYHENAGRIK
jgi:hypothetical protein